MSHFDDVDFVMWGPMGAIGLVAAVVAIIWAASADHESANDCAAHGENYIDSRTGYTLCEQDGGVVVRR